MTFEFQGYWFEPLHIKSHLRCGCNQHKVLYVIKPKKCTLWWWHTRHRVITFHYRELHTKPSACIKIRQSKDYLIFWRRRRDFVSALPCLSPRIRSLPRRKNSPPDCFLLLLVRIPLVNKIRSCKLMFTTSFLAQTEGFEPSSLRGHHDFESCPLWPLRYVCKY